jgi:hypothetical protein
MTNIRPGLPAVIALTLILVACAGTPTDASPTPASASVTLPEQAVAKVISAEPRLASITAHDPAAVGQASWFEVARPGGAGAFVVRVRVGWGDCEAGCIDEHRWQYAVEPDGRVSVVSEVGPAVPEAAWPASGAVRGTGIGGRATAGPVCPVEQIPPDPQCAARPVAGAVLVVRDARGSQLARVTTGADGAFFVSLPPGDYVVEPQPANGLMGTAGPQNVKVSDGLVSTIQLDYDTGIR